MKVSTRYKKVGDSDTWRLGSGPPLIAIHGGPGLDHSYWVKSLTPLGELRQIVFYDQVGCGKNNELPQNFTIEALVAQLINLIQDIENGKKVDIIAHSWGAYIFYESLRAKSALNLGKAILVSPVGLNRKRFDESGERLISRIPEKILSSIELMEKKGEGVAVMNMLAPFYFGEPRSDIQELFSYYNPDTYYKVVEALGEFDCSDIVNFLPPKTILLYGERDIELPEDTKELHGATSLSIIPGAGHFSFAENQTEFIAVVREFLAD